MDSQEIKAEERNAIFGEIILGYSIFEEASLKTNGSHWEPYLWRKLPLKAVFLYSIKTRARFHGIQVMMPHYQRFGEQEAQLAQQCQHTSLLHQSTRIGRCAVRRESALIADADRMPVVVPAMRSHLFQGASAVNLSVAGDIKWYPMSVKPRWRMWSWRQVSKSSLRPSGVAEQWIIIRVMVLLFIRCRRSGRVRRQRRWLR